MKFDKIKESFNKYAPEDQGKRVFCLHTGRGGRFNNPGYVTCCGEEVFAEGWPQLDPITVNNRDWETGRFCKPFLGAYDNGEGWSDDDLNGETGRVDFDGEYDRYDWTRLEDMRPAELEAVLRWLRYDAIGVEAEDLLRAWLEKNCWDIDDRLLYWLEEDEEDVEE